MGILKTVAADRVCAALICSLALGCAADEGDGAETDGGTATTDTPTTMPPTGDPATTADPMTSTTTSPTSTTVEPTTTTGPEPTSTTQDPTMGADSSSGDPIDAEFIEVDGIVSVEAEHYSAQVNNEPTQVTWFLFEDGAAPPEVTCETNTPCDGGNAPACNQYADCDPDSIDPAEASGNAYVEALPDRRRDDSEPGTGNLGVVNDPAQAAALEYRVYFEQPGRYYAWGHARGLGPAANGIHLGLDGTWPENDLIDPSSMRMQFGNGWAWTQNRRGGAQHTGVSGTDEVSQRDANMWLQIDTAGVHTITWAMREDGLEFDKFVLALDPEFVPRGDGPPETAL